MKTYAKTKRKAPKFVKDYIETNFNAAEAARRNFNIRSKKNEVATASNVGIEYLNKPYVQKTLAEVLEEDGFSDDDIRSILKRNAKQNKNLPASNSALDMVLKVRGSYAAEKKLIAYKNLTDIELNQQLQELQQEIKQLNDKRGED